MNKYVYEKNLDNFIYLHDIFISSCAILTPLLCFVTYKASSNVLCTNE